LAVIYLAVKGGIFVSGHPSWEASGDGDVIASSLAFVTTVAFDSAA
jgi:hypothetical protein